MTKIAKIFLVALFFTFAACNKDDESVGALAIIGDTSLDFEYGQTKEVHYTVKNIASFGDVTFPKGWSVTRQNGWYTITSPSPSNSEAELSGEVKLVAVSTKNITITRPIKVAVRIAEEITRPANSFIVSEPGVRYKFNARRRGNETVETLTNAAGATRVWSTSKTGITNVSYENGYIYFATAEGDTLQETNAVIAVTDSEKNVLWSWHIWATDFDPAAEPDVLAGQQVMSRNLGAFANSNVSAEEAWKSYGLYFQWGRKDPFIGPDAWDSTTGQMLYDASGNSVTHAFAVSSAEIGSIEYAVAHPNTFIAGAEPPYHWLSLYDGDLWDSSPGDANTTPKTLYDPCPAGWRVAPRDVFLPLATNPHFTTDPADFNIVGEYNYGWTFLIDGQEIFFPAAGRRSFSPSLATSARNYTNVVNDDNGSGSPVGFYWYSDATNSFAFRKDHIDVTLRMTTPIEQIARAGGFPVRCVVE